MGKYQTFEYVTWGYEKNMEKLAKLTKMVD